MFWIIIFCSLIDFSTQDCIEKVYETRRGECIRYSSYFPDICVEYEETGIYELRCYLSNGVFVPLDPNHEIGRLYVTTSNLTDLKAIYFKNITDLEKLTMHGDNIGNIESGAFDVLSKLRTVNLTNNNLTSLNRLFLLETNITELDLSKNKISDITESALKLANDLRLILRENKIKNVIFLNSNCEQLSSLDVSQNSIDKFVFPAACANLTHLNVSKNNLKEFYTNVTSSTSLKTLDLSFNNLTSVDSNVFAYFERLERLNLSHNPLFVLDTSPINLFQNNRNLKLLALTNTGIKSLQIGTLTKLGNLIELDLSSNNLNDLQKDLFHGLYSLKNLDLSNNRLTRFDYSELNSLNLIDLNNNLWDCDYLSDTAKKLMENRVNIVHGDTYDTENILGITCTTNSEAKITINITTNSSSGNSDSLTKYIENVLEKQQITFEQSMIENQNVSGTFWKDINRGYKDLFGNIQKDAEEGLYKVVNALGAMGDKSENITNDMRSTINDMNAIQRIYNDTYWKNFNIDRENSLKNIQDNFEKLYSRLAENTVFIKNVSKAASLENTNLESKNNRYDKFLVIGLYAIVFFLIILSAIFILSIYKFRKNRKFENVEFNNLPSL